jgi:hypothetical protein
MSAAIRAGAASARERFAARLGVNERKHSASVALPFISMSRSCAMNIESASRRLTPSSQTSAQAASAGARERHAIPVIVERERRWMSGVEQACGPARAGHGARHWRGEPAVCRQCRG